MFPGIRGLFAAAVIVTMGGAVVIAGPQRSAGPVGAAACVSFEARIGDYAALHRRLESGLPPLAPTRNMAALMVNRQRLASAIKAARPDARQGDIFTPEVAAFFRELIAEALGGRDSEALLRDLFEEPPAFEGSGLRVYEPYPDWAVHEMPVVLLQWLPALPEDIEYRLVDHDLVLWDIHANLIVDILPNAIGRPTS